MEYDPLFLDFTWGAGGSTSALTFDLCKMVKESFGANPNMHLTCTNMDTELIITALNKCKAAGISNILALRGDPPVGQDRWTASDLSLACAGDLVKYIKDNYDDFFSIAVAGYPEGHPNNMIELPAAEIANLTTSEMQRYSKHTKSIPSEADPDTVVEEPIIFICRDPNFEKEMTYLKSKIDAGAKFIITQMFFDVEIYGYFVHQCRAYGIMVPIIPGIMCISNYGGFQRMIKFCKTRVRDEILAKMEEIKDNVEAIKSYGIELGIQMCRRLQELGAPGFHFYTLNTAPVTIAIIEGLGYHRVKEVVELQQPTANSNNSSVELTA
jgi:methylenetetrahydrofolate reductase (NADPH)